MKCFIALSEDQILTMWMQNPKSVVPFSRPFVNSAAPHNCCGLEQAKRMTFGVQPTVKNH